jgi:hypothetical protein
MNVIQKQRKAQRKRVVSAHKRSDLADQIQALLSSKESMSIIANMQPDYRERIFTPTLTLSVFLQQVLDSDGSCQAAVNRIVSQQIREDRPVQSARTGAYCRARRRLPTSIISELTRNLGAQLNKAVPSSWRWKNRPIKLVDGTTLSMPDTQENQERFPQPNTQEAGIGFPLIRAVAVMSSESGALLDFALGPWQGKQSGEHALLRTLLHNFDPGDIVIGDAYYSSYWLITDLIGRGADVLMEAHGARDVDFRRGKRIGKKDHIVQWQKPKVCPPWMTQAEYNAYPTTITVREICVGSKVLVTTLTSIRSARRLALAKLYYARWGIELRLREIKETMGMNILRCKTPDMVEKEIWVHLLAYNIIRIIMGAAAAHQAMESTKYISFKHTLQLVFCIRFLDNGVLLMGASFWNVVCQICVGKRPGRIEPRCVKRRPKPYPKMRKSRAELREEILKNGHPQRVHELK